MGIVKDSIKTPSVRKGGRADVEKLLEHTAIHPNGRISLDPATGRVRNPKNNVLFVKKLNVKVEGHVVGVKEVAVNGGHVRAENSVWRIALRGPSRYHWKVIKDDENYVLHGRMDRSAPKLETIEMQEYQWFRVFLKETDTVVEEFHWDETDAAFYAWLSKQDKKKITIMPMAIAPVYAPVEPRVR